MKLILRIVLLLSAIPWISPTSKEVTEEDIKKLVEGITEFRKASIEKVYEDGTFDKSKYNEQEAFRNAELYDFIIVGAGAAGSVLANRLSEISQWNILLLEAGETESIYTDIPVHSGVLQGSKYNWGYLSQPQKDSCLGMIDQQCTAPTGKGLGGGTVINGMVYTRGNPRDYDLWGAQGNRGWSYKDVLPYFKKAEDCGLPECNPIYHGHGGPLYVEEAPYVLPLQKTFLEAGKKLGYNIVDYNGQQQLGFGKLQATTKHGRRNSAAQGYLHPIKTRKNLRIKTLSEVVQILVNSHNKETIGVKYIQNNTMYIAKAHKETILTAGPYNSPKLLMLSGIGPREDLEKLKIPVIRDAPVGKHLKDHPGFQGPTFVLNISKFDELTLHDQASQWLKEGKGPLSSSGLQALAFLKINASDGFPDYPDVELILSKAGFAPSLRIKKDYQSVLDPPGNFASFRIGVMPAHPKSLGTVKLRSKDPFHAPLVSTNFFTDPDGYDIQTTLSGIKKAIEVARTGPFRELGARLVEEPVEQCKGFGFGSDEYWKCAARYLSISLRHQVGTCRMGPYTDKYAVVSSKLVVYGVHRLRVADSSVIPVTITGHTHAAANMVGEKAADLIKEFWKISSAWGRTRKW